MAAQKTTVSSRAIWNILFRGFMKKEKYWKQRIMRFSIQDYLIDTISPSMYILYQIRCRTGRDGFWKDFIQSNYLLKSGIDSLPKRAEYVQDPSELIFDTGLDIIPQYEHIFEETENNQRLPENIRNSVMKVPLFDGALRQTKRMLEADYRTAIPQYYDHNIQFLIPVCLQDPARADLALACVKTEDGKKYLGRTCLTLKMAYHNARLLAKIHSNWLCP